MCVYTFLLRYSVQLLLVARSVWMIGRAYCRASGSLWGFVGPVGSDVALPGFMQKVGAPLLVCRRGVGVPGSVGLGKNTGPLS